MAKFRKRPIVIEAEQFLLGADPRPVGVEPVWVDQNDDGIVLGTYDDQPSKPAHLAFGISTLEGWHVVKHGDWIITGIQKERYPCKPDIFAATYEAVDELPT